MKHAQNNVKSKKFFRKTDYADYWTEKIRTRKYEEGYTDYFIDLMEVEKRHRILEIGAGEGRFIPKLVNKGAIYFGIDISDRILKKAKEHVQTHNKSNINLIVADAENLPFHENLFDCVFCFATIFFLPDMEKALIEMSKVGKGKVLIEFRNLLNLLVARDYFMHLVLINGQRVFNFIFKINAFKDVLGKVFGQKKVDRLEKYLSYELMQPYYPITPFRLEKMFQTANMKITFIRGLNLSKTGKIKETPSKMKWTKPVLIVEARS